MKYIGALMLIPVWGVICRGIYELFMFGWNLL